MKTENRTSQNQSPTLNRRRLLQIGAGLAAAGSLPSLSTGCASTKTQNPAVKNARIKQSIVHWCFEAFGEKWTVEQTAQVARELGCLSVELVDPKHFPTLRQYGLTCAIGQINMNPAPPFVKGFNNPNYWPQVTQATRDAIDAAAAFGVPSVICFTGYSARDVDKPDSPELTRGEGAKNCVEGFKQIVGYAEQKNVTLCLEMLNTRDTSHPMKGHPGYQGNHTDYCIDIIKQVGSPRLKLLFDIYHVQIMDGDLIRRVLQLKEYIGHVHTAGNPGRGELDETQEINFPPIMQALLDIGYDGYVGQEFIPTRDPRASLRQAVTLCDI